MENTNEEQKIRTKEIFCAACQAVTTHEITVDGHGDFVFTCVEVMTELEDGKSVGHRFVKFPNLEAAELKQVIEKHEEVNIGQVDPKVMEAELDAKLAEIADMEDNDEDEPKKGKEDEDVKE